MPTDEKDLAEGIVKIHVDGVTHAARGTSVVCGLEVFDRSLVAIVDMFVAAAGRDIDCMACVAGS